MTEITPGSGPAGDTPPAGAPGASRGTEPVRGGLADLPEGTPTGNARAADQATAEVVGARRSRRTTGPRSCSALPRRSGAGWTTGVRSATRWS